MCFKNIKKKILYLIIFSFVLISCQTSLPKSEIPKFEMGFISIDGYNIGGEYQNMTNPSFKGTIRFDSSYVKVELDNGTKPITGEVIGVYKNDDGYSFDTNFGNFEYKAFHFSDGKKFEQVTLKSGLNLTWFNGKNPNE